MNSSAVSELPEADLTTLVLLAALGPPEIARSAWHRATEIESIDIWPNELARPLPRIFLRLKDDPTTPHVALLRGIFRAAWAANMLRVRHCLPVLADLDEIGIPYRLIKGTAICSLTDEWGARRMGDVDLVVPEAEMKVVREHLAAHGFTERVPHSYPSGLWDDSHGGIIDLHWARNSDPYLGAILTGPSFSPEVLDSRVTVPSPEFSVAIAVRHARDGSAASDYIQGLIDMDRLLPQCNRSQLELALDELDVWTFAAAMLEQLRVLGSDRAIGQPPLGLPPRRTGHSAKRQQSISRMVRHAIRVAQRRTLNPISLAQSAPDLKRQPLLLAWLSLAQLRPIEQFFARTRGGFLPSPVGTLPSNTLVSILPKEQLSQELLITSIRIRGVEDRWKIRIRPQRRLRIRLSTRDVANVTPRMLFVNGRLHGFFPTDGQQSTLIDLPEPQETLEFSLRLAPGIPQPSHPIEMSMELIGT